MLVGPRPALNALPTRGPPWGWGGPRVQETLRGGGGGGGERQPHRRVVQNSWITERWGRRSGCKTKHCCGLGGRARCRHRKVVQNLYTTTWQSNIVGPFTPPPPPRDQEPGPTRVVGRLKGSYVGVFLS